MRILLDTHILLWALAGDPRLPDKGRKLIGNEDNEIYYSLVSLWEVELKHLAHPDLLTVSAEELAGYCRQAGFLMIPIREKHIYALETLKRREDSVPHKDPFDRLLITQASTENMMLVTHDARLADYNEPCVLPI